MATSTKKDTRIQSVGKSWVLDLPDDFALENKLAKDTQVLITFKGKDVVTAEVIPPLSRKIQEAGNRVLKKRRGAYEELRKIGD